MKHTQYQVNSPDPVQLANKSQRASAADASQYMNQNQGVVINEIVDSPAPSAMNFDNTKVNEQSINKHSPS